MTKHEMSFVITNLSRYIFQTSEATFDLFASSKDFPVLTRVAVLVEAERGRIVRVEK